MRFDLDHYQLPYCPCVVHTSTEYKYIYIHTHTYILDFFFFTRGIFSFVDDFTTWCPRIGFDQTIYMLPHGLIITT